MNRSFTMVVLCLILLAKLNAQQMQYIDTLLNAYNIKAPQEKIHIHFDNSSYLPGQTIWYKAYLQKGNEVSDLSKNLYMEWFDEQGKLLNRIIAPIIGSTASGSYAIPEKFKGTRLRVMAYTRWMLNFDSTFLFQQTLPVVQAQLPASSIVLPSVTSLQFFPEGGEWVETLSSVIAFKAVNTVGLPVAVSGNIMNQNKKIITGFATEHDGMGTVTITPDPGENYTAEWTDPQGVARTTALPTVRKNGLILSVKQKNPDRSFSIQRQSLLEERFKKITIVATMNQQVLFRAAANFTDKEKITASLPVVGFPSGVLLLTVFDANNLPVAERVFFINNEEYRVSADIVTDTLNLDKRGKNIYHIDIADTIPASMSLSVMDGDGVYDSSQTIISQLLLSAEIKGYVHNPAYYFYSTEDSITRQLDLVMLTNGWRRFLWQDVLTGKAPLFKYERDSSYLSIAGKIDKLSDAKIKKAETLNLILVAKDSSKQFVFTPLNADGSFREDNLVLFDTTKVYYQMNKTILANRNHVSINTTFLPFDSTHRMHMLEKYLPDTTGRARIKAIEAEQKRVEELIRQSTLKEVIVKAKLKPRIQEMNERYARGFFEGGNSKDFNVIDDPFSISSINALMYLQAKVAGLIISDPTGPYPRIQWRQTGVALFVDEFPVGVEVLQTISMSSIAFIKVFSPPFLGVFGRGASGAIAVYTRKGDDMNAFFVGLNYTSLPGYTPVKEFYTPDYSVPQVNFSQTDLRRTLLWKPNIRYTGEGKKIMFSFYNNDISHTLQVVLEGMTQEGRLIRVSKLLRWMGTL